MSPSYKPQHDDTDVVLPCSYQQSRLTEVKSAVNRKANELADALTKLRLKTEEELKQREAQYSAEEEARLAELARHRHEVQLKLEEQRRELHEQTLRNEKEYQLQFKAYEAAEAARLKAIEEQRKKEEAERRAREEAERKRREEEVRIIPCSELCSHHSIECIGTQ
jgi:colicin import membrane protein